MITTIPTAAAYCLAVAWPVSWVAYIDPGTGSLVFQMVLAGLLGVAVAFRNLRAWIANVLSRAFGRGGGSRSQPGGDRGGPPATD